MNYSAVRVFAILICLVSQTFGQVKDKGLIQFSGVIISSDSSKAVPFVNVIIKGTNKGTVSDFWGFFSIAAKKTDTIEFSAVGYKKAHLLIPDTVKKEHYYTVIEMYADTFLLNTVVIRPMPPIEQFKHIFLEKKVPDDLMERAKKNLDKAQMQAMFDKMPNDGYMNYRYTSQQNSERLYYAGQLAPIRLLDPLAWARFIKAWQNGELKSHKEKNDKP